MGPDLPPKTPLIWVEWLYVYSKKEGGKEVVRVLGMGCKWNGGGTPDNHINHWWVEWRGGNNLLPQLLCMDQLRRVLCICVYTSIPTFGHTHKWHISPLAQKSLAILELKVESGLASQAMCPSLVQRNKNSKIQKDMQMCLTSQANFFLHGIWVSLVIFAHVEK